MEKVIYLSYFRSGMAFKAHPRIGAAHAFSVVNHLYQRLAGIVYYQSYFSGGGIHGVFQQFLNGTCGPLDHFAGSYLVSDIIG
jgi:hypothetical protein